VVFTSDRDGRGQIYRKDTLGPAPEERLTDGPKPKMPLDWRRDGRYLLYRQAESESGNGTWDLFALPLQGGGQPIPVATTPFNENVGRFSPDGLWIAYQSNDTGRPEIYLQAFQAGATNGRHTARTQISNTGGSDMKWRDDGRELYYETLDGRIMAVEIQTGANGIRLETPRELFMADTVYGQLHSFDATGDGQRFLLLLNPRNQEPTRLTVVTNWHTKLR
jgi:Tol biopolymer transport system component